MNRRRTESFLFGGLFVALGVALIMLLISLAMVITHSGGSSVSVSAYSYEIDCPGSIQAVDHPRNGMDVWSCPGAKP